MMNVMHEVLSTHKKKPDTCGVFCKRNIATLATNSRPLKTPVLGERENDNTQRKNSSMCRSQLFESGSQSSAKKSSFERSSERGSREICVHDNQASLLQPDDKVLFCCNGASVGFVTLHGCAKTKENFENLLQKLFE